VTEPTTIAQCRAITVEGHRCRHWADPDSPICDVHEKTKPCRCGCRRYYMPRSVLHRDHVGEERPELICKASRQDGTSCPSIAEVDRELCRYHDSTWPRCLARDDRGHPCSSKAEDHGRCDRHEGAEAWNAPQPGTGKQCRGRASTGVRCTADARPGGWFCGRHDPSRGASVDRSGPVQLGTTLRALTGDEPV
jgi:hypothetical protein